MEITRRGFLSLSGAVGSGIFLSGLGIDLRPTQAYAEGLDKMNRIKAARQVTTICCYCSVGCGLICSVDKLTGKIFNIEGDPEHPINEGSLCAKGAGLFDLTEANKHRLTKVLYRKPYGTGILPFPGSPVWSRTQGTKALWRKTPRASWLTAASRSAITAAPTWTTRSAG